MMLKYMHYNTAINIRIANHARQLKGRAFDTHKSKLFFSSPKYHANGREAWDVPHLFTFWKRSLLTSG
jgi:hypothetical protein